MRRFLTLFVPLLIVGPVAAQTIIYPLELGKPVVLGGIQVIPILSNETTNSPDTISLHEAANRSLVRISDSKAAYGAVWVENAAKVPLVILPGELVSGGHQDQMFEQVSVVLPGQAVDVPTYCVEPGRGMGPSPLFAVSNHLAPDRLRSIALRASNRFISRRKAGELIWEEVARINRAQNHPSRTGSLWATLADEGTESIVSDVATKLQALWPETKNSVGMMFCMNGKIYSADLFPSHQGFEAHRVDTFRMYGLSSIIEAPPAGRLDLDLCEGYLRAAVSASRVNDGPSVNSTLWGLGDQRLLSTEGSPIGTGLGSGGAGRPGFLYGLYLPGN